MHIPVGVAQNRASKVLTAQQANSLQVAILNLFVTLKSRFSNLVIGVISRESVKKAFSNGIIASQIVGYLTSHAHSEMRRKVGRPVPWLYLC